jgi:PIN domain nuclease of toxin-antitoxin system
MAKYLLDSNAFLAFKAGQSAPQALSIIESGENQVFVSLASVWELAIKAANGKLPTFATILAGGAAAVDQTLQESGIALLTIEVRHAIEAALLPQHHRNPFDRMMIAQARVENLTVVTRDRMFARYGVPILPA